VVLFLESLPEAAHPEWRRAMQYLFLLIHHKREPEEQAALNRLMIELMEADREEVREMAATSAQVLEARGRKQGRIEGKLEGKLEGKSEMLMAQLEQKFGLLPAETVTALQSMSEAQLTRVGLRLLSAQTLEDLAL
jgi:predicted transposase YdaD